MNEAIGEGVNTPLIVIREGSSYDGKENMAFPWLHKPDRQRHGGSSELMQSPTYSKAGQWSFQKQYN